jgi:ABC-type glycerol-3-phosphate transport system permease component
MKGHFISIYYLIFHARFKTFPKSFEEAASIDGAGHFRILFQIMLPMVKNLFWTVFLLQFIQFWNDYYTPLVYMPSYPTLAYGMWYYNNSRENVLTNIPMKITGCILMLIPVLIIFSIFGKRLMVNLIEGGDKET